VTVRVMVADAMAVAVIGGAVVPATQVVDNPVVPPYTVVVQEGFGRALKIDSDI
jgi:hypothetical protein